MRDFQPTVISECVAMYYGFICDPLAKNLLRQPIIIPSVGVGIRANEHGFLMYGYSGNAQPGLSPNKDMQMIPCSKVHL